MHRMHHTYSDTEKDPHSPYFFKDIMGMMLHTAIIFRGFVTGKNLPDRLKNEPEGVDILYLP